MPNSSRGMNQQYEHTMIREFGFRLSHAMPCPRVVIGKRCLQYHENQTCICEEFRFHPLDHVWIWLDRQGRRVLTCEPYDLEDETLIRFRTALDELGIMVTVHPKNFWFRGTTLLMCQRR
jgi:hypothetical protein